MGEFVNFDIVKSIALRTFKHFIEAPIAYVVGFFFYGCLGGFFGLDFFVNNRASIDGVGMVAPWFLWFVIPILTMGLICEELRSGTFEQLATLPLRDWEIVLGKFFGFAILGAALVAGLLFYPLLIVFFAQPKIGLDWGATFGVLIGIYLLILTYGAMGLFASSLAKNQVVALIIGMLFCTFFFFLGQFAPAFPLGLSSIADFLGVLSHYASIGRGVFDSRDLIYFASIILVFLYLTVQRLTTRRF